MIRFRADHSRTATTEITSARGDDCRSIARATMRHMVRPSQRDFRLAGPVGSCLSAVGLVLLVLRDSWVGAILLAVALAVVITASWMVRSGSDRTDKGRPSEWEAGP